MDSNIIFTILILVFSVIIHEVSHGYAALFLGDPTAKYQGRLTLNPLKHLDPVGSVIVPILTSLSGFTFGWAKPVPFNPYNLKNRRWGEAIVAFAGPFSNLAVALVFSILLRVLGSASIASDSFFRLMAMVVLTNIVLAVFNLVPVPPLDGSKILFSVLPPSLRPVQDFLEKYGIVLVFVLVFFLWKFLNPIIFSIFSLFVGI